MIIVDFSQCALAGVFAFSDNFKKGNDPDKMLGIIRHSLIMSLLSYKLQYGNRYGEIVLACDSKNYWRRDVYPQYKAHRKKVRQESDLDWEAIFKYINNVKDELQEHFPWKILEVDGAEGDDIIAILTKAVVSQRVVMDGLFESSEPVMIISSDGDMRQLHVHGDITQWSPMQKKLVAFPESDFLVDKIIRGDAGDGVPSVLMEDDWFTNPDNDGKRAKPVTKKVIEKYSNRENLTLEELERYDRNEQLISFERIPIELAERIILEYNKEKVPVKKYDTMQFLMGVRAKQLLERVDEISTVYGDNLEILS